MLKPKLKKTHHERQKLQTARKASKPAAPSRNDQGPLDPEQLRKINAYWRAANYLSVGQIYLCENPLLRQPLELKHVKQLLLQGTGAQRRDRSAYITRI